MNTPLAIANRIVNYGVKPADQFTAHPDNARMHPQFQRDVMRAALNRVGFVAPVVESLHSGYLLDGHERVWQGLQHNNAPIPYVVVDVSEAEEAYILATFDPITSLAQYDQSKLDDLLRDVQSDDVAIQTLLGQVAAQSGLYQDFDPYAHWQGMPEFEQEDQTSFQSIHLHFATKEDRDNFAELINQTISDNTRSLWYPEATTINQKDIYE